MSEQAPPPAFSMATDSNGLQRFFMGCTPPAEYGPVTVFETEAQFEAAAEIARNNAQNLPNTGTKV